MSETPNFIRNFSKENSKEERDELAQNIRDKRVLFFDGTESNEKESLVIKNNIDSLIEIQENLNEDIEKLNSNLEFYSSSFVRKTFSYFKIKNIKSELELINIDSNQNIDELNSIKIKKSILEKELIELGNEYSKLDKIIPEFLDNEIKKWEDSEFSKEDIQKYFKDEFLSELTIDQYVTLLKRFPTEMVTHVTRQGIRDHTGMMWHTRGEGEFHNGFLDVIKDGKIESALGVHIKEQLNYEAVKNFIKIDELYESYKNERQDLTEKGAKISLLDKLISENFLVTEYFDRNSVHLAAGEVADELYGAETKNEIFFSFPSAYIASQYYYCGDIFDTYAGGQRNDHYIFNRESKGIDINSGIVFIPENSHVSVDNGSIYKIREDSVVLEDTVLVKEDFENSILSKEYWEKYFEEHKDLKPSKIVYYNIENSPTEALNLWKEENGLKLKNSFFGNIRHDNSAEHEYFNDSYVPGNKFEEHVIGKHHDKYKSLLKDILVKYAKDNDLEFVLKKHKDYFN